MIYSNQLLFRVSCDALNPYSFTINQVGFFLADAETDIVRTGTDIPRTDTGKAIFLNRG